MARVRETEAPSPQNTEPEPETTATPEVSFEEAESRLLELGTDRMREQAKSGVVTPIELAKALNVRPQQVYNYIRNSRIAAHKTEDTQKLVVSWEDAVAEAQRLFSKRQA